MRPIAVFLPVVTGERSLFVGVEENGARHIHSYCTVILKLLQHLRLNVPSAGVEQDFHYTFPNAPSVRVWIEPATSKIKNALHLQEPAQIQNWSRGSSCSQTPFSAAEGPLILQYFWYG
jgi:hypothetical protein